MKDFFANMNFPRWVIVISLLASSGLGYLVFERHTRLAEIELELNNVKKVVREIQEKGILLDSLQRVAAKEGLKGESRPDDYIRTTAADSKVNIGQVKITRENPRSPMPNVEDHVYSITPHSKDRAYSRGQIGNFLYRLEEASRRVRVTDFSMQPVDRTRPGEIGNDRWTFDAKLTSRQAINDEG